MRLSLSELASRLNSSYWFVPLCVTLGGVLLAFALLLLDSRVSLADEGVLALVRPSSPEGARALLSAVITAMITAISVTFSVTIVALTVAAQHFGPRVLNNFVRQTSAQVVLGTFMATFVYAVLVLGAVRGTEAAASVPELAVFGAVVLVAASVGALIYYVHHVSTTLQIGELATEIAADFRRSVSRLDEAAGREPAGSAQVPAAPDEAAVVPADGSGYVQRIDYESIAREAEARGAMVWMRREPGAFVLSGAPLALVHPTGACDEDFAATVRRACVLGRDRTLWHDPEFAVKQLVEIALRALSPGVNEPFTAVTCIDRLAEGLARAATARPPRAAWPDSGGRPRVFAQPQPFVALLRAAYDPVRIFAGSNPAIYVRLLDSLAELALVAPEPEALRQHVERTWRAAGRSIADGEDLAYVEGRYRDAMRQLAGRPSSARR